VSGLVSRSPPSSPRLRKFENRRKLDHLQLVRQSLQYEEAAALHAAIGLHGPAEEFGLW